MSHEWDCRCPTCDREAAWQAHEEPDERRSPWEPDDEASDAAAE